MAVLASVMIFTIVMDLFGNILVILSIIRNKKLRTTGNYFVINLALADLAVAVYPYPTILVALFQNGWTLGETHCRLSAAVICLSCIGSVYNITAIAINRYCCICHASRYNLLFSEKNTYICIGFIWLLSIITFLPMVFYDMLQYDPRIYSCTVLRSVNLSCTLGMEITHFFVTTSIVIFCYTKIWIVIIEVKFRLRKESKQKLKSNELHQFFIMFLVFALFSVCWGPYSIIGFTIAVIDVESKIPCWVYPVSSFLAYFNSCLNGILYGVFNQKFRNEYKRINAKILAVKRDVAELKVELTQLIEMLSKPHFTNHRSSPCSGSVKEDHLKLHRSNDAFSPVSPMYHLNQCRQHVAVPQIHHAEPECALPVVPIQFLEDGNGSAFFLAKTNSRSNCAVHMEAVIDSENGVNEITSKARCNLTTNKGTIYHNANSQQFNVFSK
ncbi:melatonin receptor type 1C-like [Protopterus annectens]|uniref:melatonin receptor type 1C-like n=1 Tax=Protopterus annectens TaxID=7888 RepID=UPI001CFA3B2D|nr:melatonin receptor type 1C-like [Protopterus annectens]